MASLKGDFFISHASQYGQEKCENCGCLFNPGEIMVFQEWLNTVLAGSDLRIFCKSCGREQMLAQIIQLEKELDKLREAKEE